MWEWMTTDHNLAYVSICISTCALLIYIITLISTKMYRKHRGLPLGWTEFKFNTRTITNISVLTAVSVSVTIVVAMVIPVTIFPPIRVAFEGIMIKITGMLFGSIIGIIVGFITELLVLMFVPSYIEPAYFFVAVFFGMWGGFCSYAFKWEGKKQLRVLGLITIFIILATTFMFFFMQKLAGKIEGDTVSFIGIPVSKNFFPYLFIIMMLITIIVIYTIVFTLYFKKKFKILRYILPVMLLCITTEILCTLTIASWGDKNIIVGAGYTNLLFLRLVQIPMKITFNTAVLTTVYIVIRPLILKEKEVKTSKTNIIKTPKVLKVS